MIELVTGWGGGTMPMHMPQVHRSLRVWRPRVGGQGVALRSCAIARALHAGLKNLCRLVFGRPGLASQFFRFCS